jgi:hypothetical protein
MRQHSIPTVCFAFSVFFLKNISIDLSNQVSILQLAALQVNHEDSVKTSHRYLNDSHQTALGIQLDILKTWKSYDLMAVSSAFEKLEKSKREPLRIIVAISTMLSKDPDRITKHCFPLRFDSSQNQWTSADTQFDLTTDHQIQIIPIPARELPRFLQYQIDWLLSQPDTIFRKISLLQITDLPSCHK